MIKQPGDQTPGEDQLVVANLRLVILIAARYSQSERFQGVDAAELARLRHAEEQDVAVDQDPGALYWLSVLGELLGEARSTSSWDPETVPLRSVRGVVAERARHTSLETGPGQIGPQRGEDNHGSGPGIVGVRSGARIVEVRDPETGITVTLEEVFK